MLTDRGLQVKFYLGADGPSSEERERVHLEARRFGDIVWLPTPEGYVHNAKKGVEFLRHVADAHPSARFLIKVDDDVYWRPDPTLQMLQQRVPFRYLWGFLDLESPVPRERENAFFHSEAEWPDEFFPPYARGVLRVMSMDVVRLLAAAHRRLVLGVRGDDPSFGVHLRQVVLESGDFLQMDDRGGYSRFAMDPTCYPEGAFNPLKDTTWVVHHVGARAIRCMFEADARAGYYAQAGGQLRAVAAETYPSLCGCVDRPGTRRVRRLLRRDHRCPRWTGPARA